MSRRVASTERIGNLRVLEPRTQESYARARLGVNGKDVRENRESVYELGDRPYAGPGSSAGNLTVEGISFHVEGSATYEQNTPAIGSVAPAPVQ